MSYLIPADELSLSEKRDLRERSADAALNRAVKLGIGGSAAELTVRQPGCARDFGSALNEWRTAALAVVGTVYSCLQAIPAPTLVANKLCVFYGVAITTAPVPVSRLEFRTGAAAGNMLAEFDLEVIISSRTTEGYFGQPVPIDPLTTFAVQAVASIATAVFARVVLRGWLVEPIGQTIA